MTIKKHYQTKQQLAIEEYICSTTDHFTVADVCAHFREEGKSFGSATVYRALERLIEEGKVKKYIIDEQSAACFEYINPESSCVEPRCYHLKCRECGRLVHLNCGDIEALVSHIHKRHGFLIDMNRTVFYGICDTCSEERFKS